MYPTKRVAHVIAISLMSLNSKAQLQYNTSRQGIAYLPKSHKTQPQRPHIQVVFALDATGSMSGLIQTAKEKIWSIAGSLAQAQNSPK